MKEYQQNRNGKPWRYFNWSGDKHIRVFNSDLEHIETIKIYGYDALLRFRQTDEIHQEEMIKERIAEYLNDERKR